MGRAAIVIDKSELEAKLHELENANSFDNRSLLFAALCQTEWAKTRINTAGKVKPLTPAVVYLRVKEFNIQLKTPIGKRGIPVGTKRGPRKRREQSINDPKIIAIRDKIVNSAANHKASLREPVTRLFNRIVDGSKMAAIKLTCLECSAWESNEARNCQVTGCPLYIISPFVKYANQELTEEQVISENDD
jgi:hypothetical protein